MMVLEVKNVQYSYKSQKEKEILKNVSMQFEEKKFYTIVGASGAGKTSFLSLLAGLDLPVRGTILYNGENIQEKGLNYHRKHHVSLVFQNYNLIDYLTTEEKVQRVAIARALASNAKVLLADEPTGNLDENTAGEIIELLKKTAHELGKCVIVVTHSKYLAAQADEIIMIKDGCIESATA